MAPTDVDDEFEPVYHRYTPHRAGLPPLVPYFRELWARREFAAEMSKASLRSSNVNTVFGQLWLILNPMLTGYAQLLQGGQTPPPWMWAAAAGWALGASLVGFLFFIGREREFAVRLT